MKPLLLRLLWPALIISALSAEGTDMSPADLGKPLDMSDFERRIRDLIIPAIRQQYRVTGHYLSLEAAAEVIQVVRLGLLAAGWGELTEEQRIALGTVLEYQVHQQLRPQSGPPGTRLRIG
jgi:hypothetical protein